ncbi:MAG TPA: PepSY-associated TM helix domain-containing protein [Pedobacter sp.]|uniref:PepSY-associated TM helix domain-containing protein n=1 Tax=Pedobacter sp. TaxID=1411316 RepID=UPI002CC0677E|nr:PepSY-associated TM helix domain-containing protein [Pedobacter sp.]HMI01318.1 PepSY-associated TM helix domain-containing protein [Pedobacter sp.]
MIKKIFRTIHLYLALAAGLVIMLSCATGAIMVFEEELDHMVNHDRYYVEQKAERLPLDQLLNTAVHQLPKAKTASIKVFSDPGRSVEVALMVPEKKEAGDRGKEKQGGSDRKGEQGKKGEKGPKGGGKPGIFVYLDPYNGKVLDVYSKRESFFFQVEMLHRFLLGGQNSIGKLIIGLSTLSFLIITLTGIILWWPKNKNILMQRLKFKTGGSFKRLNHDLHIVTGFYTSIFLLVIIVTGLVMAFAWANKGIYSLTGSSMESPEPSVSVYQPGKKPVSAEAALKSPQLANVEFYNLRLPKDSSGIYTVNVLANGNSANRTDTYYIDQYSGSVIGQLKFTDKNLGQRIRSYVKPLHTGELFGLPGKVINFILVILTFTFPITGVIMWLNRIKNGKKKGRTALENLSS